MNQQEEAIYLAGVMEGLREASDLFQFEDDEDAPLFATLKHSERQFVESATQAWPDQDTWASLERHQYGKINLVRALQLLELSKDPTEEAFLAAKAALRMFVNHEHNFHVWSRALSAATRAGNSDGGNAARWAAEASDARLKLLTSLAQSLSWKAAVLISRHDTGKPVWACSNCKDGIAIEITVSRPHTLLCEDCRGRYHTRPTTSTNTVMNREALLESVTGTMDPSQDQQNENDSGI